MYFFWYMVVVFLWYKNCNVCLNIKKIEWFKICKLKGWVNSIKMLNVIIRVCDVGLIMW